MAETTPCNLLHQNLANGLRLTMRNAATGVALVTTRELPVDVSSFHDVRDQSHRVGRPGPGTDGVILCEHSERSARANPAIVLKFQNAGRAFPKPSLARRPEGPALA